MYYKLISLLTLCIAIGNSVNGANCPNDQFIKCCSSSGQSCLGLGRGCGSLATAAWNESCGSGGGNNCHCMECENSGQCVSVCGHTNYACYNGYCQTQGANNCGTTGDGDRYGR